MMDMLITRLKTFIAVCGFIWLQILYFQVLITKGIHFWKMFCEVGWFDAYKQPDM